MHEIENSDSDLLCLQEVDHINDFYGPRLRDIGYELQWTLRREKDAVMVAYKKDKFDCIRVEPIDYNDVADLF